MIMKTPILIFILSMFLISGPLYGQRLPVPEPVCAYCNAAITKGESHRSGCRYAPAQARSAPVGRKRPAPRDGSSEELAMRMFGNLFSRLFQAALAPPPSGPSPAELAMIKKQQQDAIKKQEALKKQAMEQWKKLRDEEEARMAREEAEKKQRGQELLDKMDLTGGGYPGLYAGMGSATGGGKLRPFTWKTPGLEITLIGTGVFDTSGYTSWQRLLCSAYFSGKALDAARGGNHEEAVFMNSQADKVTAGEMTDVECRIPGLQQLADIQQQNLTENNRMAEMVKLLPVVQEKLKRLQQIEVKLQGAKEEKKEAEARLKEAESKVEEAQMQAESAKTPEKKTEADDLLDLALALQNEASGEVEKAEQAEREYAGLREEGREELRGIQEKMNDGSATKSGGR